MTADTNEQELLYFNGIDGDSGDYDLPPMTYHLSSGPSGSRPCCCG